MDLSNMLPDKPKNFDLVINSFTKPVYPREVPRMTIQEHREFVQGLINDTIFTSMHIHQRDKEKGDLGRIFLAQKSDYFNNLPQYFLEDIGTLWEFLKEQSPTSVVGMATNITYPTFKTVRLCSKSDWDLACDAIKAVKAQVNLIVT